MTREELQRIFEDARSRTAHWPGWRFSPEVRAALDKLEQKQAAAAGEPAKEVVVTKVQE